MAARCPRDLHAGHAIVSLPPGSRSSGGDGSEIKQFSALVSDIYDASLDPSPWSGALEKILRIVPARSSDHLYSRCRSQACKRRITFGTDPTISSLISALFLQVLETQSGTSGIALSRSRRRFFSTTEVIPGGRLYRTLFYEQWSRPQGGADDLGSVLEKFGDELRHFCSPWARVFCWCWRKTMANGGLRHTMMFGSRPRIMASSSYLLRCVSALHGPSRPSWMSEVAAAFRSISRLAVGGAILAQTTLSAISSQYLLGRTRRT